MIDYALTTKERVKARLVITGTTWDTVIDRLIAGATSYFEAKTGVRFKETTHTEELYDGNTITGSDRRWLILKNAPVSTFTLLEYKAGINSSPSWTTIDSDEYDVLSTQGMLRVYAKVPNGYQNVRATYKAGYLIDFDNEYSATHTLPYELTEACEKLVVAMYKRKDSEGKNAETFDASSIDWGTLTDDFIKEVIQRYKRNDLC